jgi:ankyrin repeat protein
MFPNDIDFTTTFTSEHFDGKLNILEALCRFDNVDVLDLLVKHGGDLSQMPNFDNNPILYCCRYKSWKAVKYLLDHSSNNKIPLIYKIQTMYIHCGMLLLMTKWTLSNQCWN